MGDSAYVRAWLKRRARARRASWMLAMLSAVILLTAIGVGVWPFLQRDGSDRRLAAAAERATVAAQSFPAGSRNAMVERAVEYNRLLLGGGQSVFGGSVDPVSGESDDDFDGEKDSEYHELLKTDAENAAIEAKRNLDTVKEGAADAADPAKVQAAKDAAQKADENLKATQEAVQNAEQAKQDAKTGFDAADKIAKDAKAQLNAAKAELADAKSAAKTAKDQYDKTLADKNAADQTVQDARTAADRAEQAVADANAKLTDAKAEKTAADKAKTDAQKAYDSAVSAADKAKAFADQADKLAAQGAAGYFKSQNAELAYRVLTDSSVSDYLKYVNLGAEGDATSLDNLLAALDLIDECNALRAKEGLAPLKVSDTAMACAMVQADAARGHYYHNQQYVNMMGTENLAWGPSEYDPYDGWWTDEKAKYDAGNRNWEEVGHYMNMSNANSTSTGVAVAQGDENYGNAWAQEFTIKDWVHLWNEDGSIGLTDTPDRTAAEFRASVEAYVKSIRNAQSDYQNALKAVERAKAALDAANGRSETADKALQAAQTAADEAAKTVTENAAKLSQAVAAQTAAQDAYGQADAANTTAQNTLAAKTAAYDTAKSTADSADSALAAAKAKLEIAGNTLADAQTAYNKAKSDKTAADLRVETLTNAEAALAKAQAAYDKAEAEYKAAEAAASAAQGTLADANAKLDEASKAAERGEKTLKAAKDAQDRLTVATAELKTATEANAKAQAKLAAAKADYAEKLAAYDYCQGPGRQGRAGGQGCAGQVG